jgi:hypothetical protein
VSGDAAAVGGIMAADSSAAPDRDDLWRRFEAARHAMTALPPIGTTPHEDRP